MKYSEAERKQRMKDLEKFAALALKLNAPISGNLKNWVSKQNKALTK